MQRLFQILTCAFLVLLMILPITSSAHALVEVNNVEIKSSSQGYKLHASYSFELPRGLEEALQRGIPLYFTTEVEISRPRRFWFDAKPVVASHTIRIGYNVLTRQYSVTNIGKLQQNVNSLEEALNLVRHPQHWVFASKDELSEGDVYSAAIRFQLDVSHLPKPFQINVINSSTWRLSTDWKRFTFIA